MAQPRRRAAAAPKAPAVLDERGQALSSLLPGILTDHKTEIDAALDEVVVRVQPDDVQAVLRLAKDTPELDFNYLRCISVVDYIATLEINYHLFSLERRHKMVVKTSVSPDDPHVPTAVTIWRGADWFEREAHDLFGVVFDGHPNLVPLLLYEGFEGYPGRKSFPFHEYTEW